MPGVARALAPAALILYLEGCGDDPVAPSIASVAGTYQATTLTVTTGGVTTDLLAIGASVTITLAADGTTTGRLFVPNGNEDDSDLDVQLTGTWSLSGSGVAFSHPLADTFIRDVVFTVDGNQLRTQATFGGDTVVLILTK